MSDLIAITPSDTNPFGTPARNLWVGVAGDITLWTANDGVAGAVTIKGVSAGWFGMPGPGIVGIKATGTTATNIVAITGTSFDHWPAKP